MSTYSMNDISTNTDRFKIYLLPCNQDELEDKIQMVKSRSIDVINVGKELASYIHGLNDYSYLNLDVYDYCKKLLNNHKSQIKDNGNDAVAIFNFGILLEPVLQLNTVQLFREFSKSTSLIIIWDNQNEEPDRLHWLTQKTNFFLDFSESQLKKLQYAI